jgi:heat-inducible transcriptional repressor
VTLESAVRQLMLHLPVEKSQDELTDVAGALNAELRGMSASEIVTLAANREPVAKAVVDLIVQTMQLTDAARQTAVRASGLENMLGRPGVEELDIQAVIDLAYGGGILSALLPQIEPGSRVQVFIGDESLPLALRRLGVIVSTYGVAGEVSGLLGVVGPTRMYYWRTIATVRYMARLINDLVADLYPGAGERKSE